MRQIRAADQAIPTTEAVLAEGWRDSAVQMSDWLSIVIAGVALIVSVAVV
jgi:hypothetical protein